MLQVGAHRPSRGPRSNALRAVHSNARSAAHASFTVLSAGHALGRLSRCLPTSQTILRPITYNSTHESLTRGDLNHGVHCTCCRGGPPHWTSPPNSGTVLIRDGLEAEAGFLLVQLIKSALTGGQSGGAAGGAAAALAAAEAAPAHRVVLLAAAEAASHYAAVLRKAGLNLPSLTGAGRLAVVELLPQLRAPAGPPSLRQVHALLAAAVAGESRGDSSTASSSGVCLVVDDLTVLHCLADSPSDWAAFLHACVCVGQSPGGAFVGLAHGGVPDDDSWQARLEHAAAVVLETDPLASGRSADITAQLSLTVRHCAGPATAAGAAQGLPAAARSAPGHWQFCYKLGEMGASYVAQAQASGVL